MNTYHTAPEEKNPIQVAGRLFGALEYLAEHGETGLTELAEHLDLNKSTAHRIVSSLQYMGYARQRQESGKYELTFKIVDLSNEVIEKTDIIALIRPYMKRLAEATGETVHFVQRDGPDIVYIDKVESYQNAVRMISHIGSRMPFYRSAVGKAMAANMTEQEVRELWDVSDIEPVTPYTITDFGEFMLELDKVRDKGYAIDNEENETGVRCIGAALDIRQDASCRKGTQYAFSISVPIGRMDNDRVRALSEVVLSMKKEIDEVV